jgi:hypothetical protein
MKKKVEHFTLQLPPEKNRPNLSRSKRLLKNIIAIYSLPCGGWLRGHSDQNLQLNPPFYISLRPDSKLVTCVGTRVARFLLVKHTKTGKNIHQITIN